MVDVVGEQRVADLVAAHTREHDHRDIGLAEAMNESPPGLRVDFVFDTPVDPPSVALEVTRLMDQPLQRGWSALNPTADALQQIADDEALGGWRVTVDAYASLRRLRPVIERLMREGRDVRVMNYTSDDLRASRDPQAIVRAHREWEAQGLVSVERGPPSEGVRVAGLARGRGIDGFTDLLEGEIDANAEKLLEARPRETHLAVEVYRHDSSTFVHRTDEPDLPESIDVLWVIFRWSLAHESPPLWRLRRGGEWEVLFDPDEFGESLGAR